VLKTTFTELEIPLMGGKAQFRKRSGITFHNCNAEYPKVKLSERCNKFSDTSYKNIQIINPEAEIIPSVVFHLLEQA
jgi:hypothetical protein